MLYLLQMSLSDKYALVGCCVCEREREREKIYQERQKLVIATLQHALIDRYLGARKAVCTHLKFLLSNTFMIPRILILSQ
jgi:hypothetical protein